VWGEVILPALFDRIGWAVFIGTPKGHNFFYKQRNKAIANESGEWFHFELKASQNQWLPAGELALLKSELDEEDWEQELECSFDKSLKHSFWGAQIDEMVADGRTAPFEHNKLAPVHLAFDIGISDDTSCWFFQVINGELDVIDHFSESGLSMGEVVDLVQERCRERKYKMGDWWLPHDAAAREWQTGKTAIEQLYAKGFNVRRVPSESVYSGIQAVRWTLPHMRIHGERCADGLQALKAYQKSFNDKTQSYSRTPLHDWSSHSADAMRYLCLAVSVYDLQVSKVRRKSGSVQRDSLEALSVNTPEELVEAGLSREEADWLLMMTNQQETHYARI
jgi:phage terminase large subunit